MDEHPWLGDACSLMEELRAGQRSPAQELEASLQAIADSRLNAFCHLETEAARRAAAEARPSLPFGGLPLAVKQLDPVAGWPLTEASLVFRDRVSDHDSTLVARLRRAGVVLVGQTTASEFGGLNVSVTRLNGVTRNPWNTERGSGGSSGGSAAAVAGGLVTLATGGDGGGSIRIPAGLCGLVGMKGTAGRIPRGPKTTVGPMTVVLGCLARSVRDVARFYDVANGFDSRDPYSLPRIDGWEARLGTGRLSGLRAAICPDLGSAVVLPEVARIVRTAAEGLCAAAGIEVVDLPVTLPEVGVEWAMANLATLREELGQLWPDCADQLTTEIGFGLRLADGTYNLAMAAAGEAARRNVNEAMADLFDQVDLVFCATNPDVAPPAETAVVTKVGGTDVPLGNAGALTIPANVAGNPAISIPAGQLDGLPVGLQVMAPHHEDARLLDVAYLAEQVLPWPLVAPGAPL